MKQVEMTWDMEITVQLKGESKWIRSWNLAVCYVVVPDTWLKQTFVVALSSSLSQLLTGWQENLRSIYQEQIGMIGLTGTHIDGGNYSISTHS